MSCFAAVGWVTTSTPPTSARPPVGITRVVSIPAVVVLPAPLGPSRPKISPARTSRSRWSTARMSPGYTLVSCSVRMTTSSIAANLLPACDLSLRVHRARGLAPAAMTDPARITANGVDFAYLEAGPADGPLALCLHGFPDHALTWEPLMADLAGAGYHAVAPWMRGYSPTALAPDGNYQVASLALDAIALADALAGNGDAVLIGHDWGAIASYTAVGHRPDRFRRLVTLAVPHTGALGAVFLSPVQLQRSFYMFVFQTPLAEMILPNDDFAFIEYLWSYWSPGYTPDPAFMRALKDTLAAPGSTAAAVGYYRAMLGTIPPDPALADVSAAGNGPVSGPTPHLPGGGAGCMGLAAAHRGPLPPPLPHGSHLH